MKHFALRCFLCMKLVHRVHYHILFLADVYALASLEEVYRSDLIYSIITCIVCNFPDFCQNSSRSEYRPFTVSIKYTWPHRPVIIKKVGKTK